VFLDVCTLRKRDQGKYDRGKEDGERPARIDRKEKEASESISLSYPRHSLPKGFAERGVWGLMGFLGGFFGVLGVLFFFLGFGVWGWVGDIDLVIRTGL